MKNRFYKSFGARFGNGADLGQINAIDQGFEELGWIVGKEQVEFIYANDMGFHEEAINYKINVSPSAKLILDVQDLAPHIPTFPVDKLGNYLKEADAVTTISETVRKDLKGRTGFDSSVIYQPIKNIFQTDEYKYNYRAMFVGRVNDPNKRAILGAQALQVLGFESKEIVTVGPESPYFGGVYAGVVDENILNLLYNSVDYVICCSRHEGILLPAIEALAAGSIPVICNDLSTRHEFFADIKEYDNVYPDPISIAKFISSLEQDNLKKMSFRDKLFNHYHNNLCHKFNKIDVANRIIKIYESL